MQSKEIYLAAGCFWGAQKYLDMIDGVLATETGFANGHTQSPSYKEVYTDTTGHAETVKVVYDPEAVSLHNLLRLYFDSIDPLSVNRQGHDEGTRYRTGIYYNDAADRPVIDAVFAEVSELYDQPLAVEVCPLDAFYPAEEYHQDYLKKNPDGYCHLPAALYEAIAEGAGRKKRLYAQVQRQLQSLFEGLPAGEGSVSPEPTEDSSARAGVSSCRGEGSSAKVRVSSCQALDSHNTSEIILNAKMAEAASVLHDAFGFWWTGFYRVMGEELILGPFQGPVACLRIPFGRGVCGTAWKERRTVVVPDVEAFPGHIACSSASRSEIVVPVFSHQPDAAVTAVLDIDSASIGTFDSTDAICLERLIAALF